MAKLTGPLNSIAAHGGLARLITFNSSAGRHTAKQHHQPSKTNSPAQLLRQRKYRQACWLWHVTTVQTDYDWIVIAAPRSITAFNAYISACMSGTLPVPATIWDAASTTWDAGATLWDKL